MIIKQISTKDTYSLRLSVLKTSKDYIYQYQGDFDKSTIHFGAFIDGNLVGIISLMNAVNNSFTGNQFQLRGMAVTKNSQTKGIGKELVLKAISYCKKQNASVVWCNAREGVLEFYKKQGFTLKGNIFYIEHVGNHSVMVLKLD